MPTDGYSLQTVIKRGEHRVTKRPMVLLASSLISGAYAGGTPLPADFPIRSSARVPSEAVQTFAADIRRNALLCDGKLTIGLSQIGGTFYLIEIEKPSIVVTGTETVTSADKMNGLEWKGYLAVVGEAVRGR